MYFKIIIYTFICAIYLYNIDIKCLVINNFKLQQTYLGILLPVGMLNIRELKVLQLENI